MMFLLLEFTYLQIQSSLNRAQSLVLNEFKKIREKLVSDKELKKAKEYIKGNIILSLESTTSRMFRNGKFGTLLHRLVTIDEAY